MDVKYVLELYGRDIMATLENHPWPGDRKHPDVIELIADIAFTITDLGLESLNRANEIAVEAIEAMAADPEGMELEYC